jgi:hypothetical protein
MHMQFAGIGIEEDLEPTLERHRAVGPASARLLLRSEVPEATSERVARGTFTTAPARDQRREPRHEEPAPLVPRIDTLKQGIDDAVDPWIPSRASSQAPAERR